MLNRFIALALSLLPASGCDFEGAYEHDWTPLGGMILGGVWGFALDPEGRPIVSTNTGIVQLEGATWVDVPSDGLRQIGQLTFDTDGALYTRSASDGERGRVDQLWRRAPGQVTWERFDDGQGVQILPVQASDGVLYMGTGDIGGFVYEFAYREPGATRWTSTGVTYDLNYDSLVADDEGHVWVFAPGVVPTRINRTQSTPFPSACAGVPGTFARPIILAVEDGKVYCGADKYVVGNGVISAYDIATGRSDTLSDGSCRGGDGLECHEEFPAESGFVTQVARATSGDFFAIWAKNNGAYPYLLRLRRGHRTWEQVLDLGTPWLGGDAGLGFQLRGNRVHFYSAQYTGSISPRDGTVDPGGFYGYVYRPF